MIGDIIDSKTAQKVALVGVGNLGRALISYLNKKNTNLKVVAAFDSNPEKSNKEFSKIKCYHIDLLSQIIKKEKITIGIISVPAEHAINIAEMLVKAGIKGILNFTTAPLNLNKNIFLAEYDMITSLEKVAYFSNKS